MPIEEDIRVRGGEEAKRQIEGVAAATQQVGQASEAASGGTGRMGQAVSFLSGQLRGLVGGMLGVGGAIALFRMWRQEMEESVRRIQELRTGMAELIATGGLAERPMAEELRRITGRGPGEIGPTIDAVRDRLRRPRGQQDVFLREIAELARTRPQAGFGQIADAFVAVANAAPQLSAQQVQNIIAAGTDIGLGFEDFTRLQKLMRPGAAMGAGPADIMGYVAFAAGQLGQPREATSALEQVMQRIGALTTPEARGVLRGAGAGGPFGQRLAALQAAYAGGRLGPRQIGRLGFAGGADEALFLALMQEPGAAAASIAAARGAIAPGAPDLGAQQLAQMRADARLAEEEDRQRSEQARNIAMEDRLTGTRVETFWNLMVEEAAREGAFSARVTAARRMLQLFTGAPLGGFLQDIGDSAIGFGRTVGNTFNYHGPVYQGRNTDRDTQDRMPAAGGTG